MVGMRLALLPALLLVACRPATPATAPGTAGEDGALARATVRGPDGRLDTEVLVASVMAADMICVGEQHDDADHHRVQHELLQRLVARSDRTLALGLEMVQRPGQQTLDDYSRGALDEARLAEVLEWRTRWGFDFAMYEPLFHTAHEHGVRLLALNAPKELTRAVAKMGLAHLSPEVQDSLPELDLKDEGHRRFFWAAMGFGAQGPEPHDPHHGPEPDDPHHGPEPHDPHHDPHHGPEPHDPHHAPPHDPHHDTTHGMHGAAERFYTAQVIWDETMAEGAAAWLTDDQRQVMVIAGNGHCHQSAIPSRVKRRRPGAATLSILLQSGDVPLPPHATSDFVIGLPGEDEDGDEPPSMASR